MKTWRLFDATLFSSNGQEVHLDEYVVDYDAGLLHCKPQQPGGCFYLFAVDAVAFITKGLITTSPEAAVTIHLVDGRTIRFPKPGFTITQFGDFYQIIGDESRALINVRLFRSAESRSGPIEIAKESLTVETDAQLPSTDAG